MNVHSFFRGHLFENIKSRDTFPNRPEVSLSNDTVVVSFKREHFPNYEGVTTDFLLHRLFDYKSALFIAEEQIAHMIEQFPFIPEDFLFELKEEKTYFLSGPKGEPIFLSPSAEPMWWILSHNAFAREVYFPNNVVAYHYFIATGIIDLNDAKWQEKIETTPSK